MNTGSNNSKKCSLIPLDMNLNEITLFHEEEIIIGRSRKTKIVDLRCSRNQISLTADMKSGEVHAKRIGANLSGINGLPMKKDREYILKNGDILETLSSLHKYKVSFESVHLSDCLNTSESPSVKRKPETDLCTVKRMKGIELNLDNEEKMNSVQNTSKTVSQGWNIDEGKLMIYTMEGVEDKSKVAGFDMDGTLILTKSGKVFAENIDDWQLFSSEVPAKLRKLHNDGFKIVIFTNQAGVSTGKTKVSDLQKKIENITGRINVPIQVFISIGRGICRKPATGMWDKMLELNSGDSIDMQSSFYVGDAAGRKANWAPKKKKDFSCSDRLMALNLGIKFYTPEEFFFGYKPVKDFMLPSFIPSEIDTKGSLCDPHDTKIVSDVQEMIVMVGSPGSGKSQFCKTKLLGYSIINRDTLGAWQKCLSVAENEIKSKKNVVIDNTNPNATSRTKFIDLAKKHNIPCRCFVMNINPDQIRHNNRFRELTDSTHEPITEMIINMYKKSYKEPNLEEGFTAIVKINFFPEFDNPKLENLYKKFLLEK